MCIHRDTAGNAPVAYLTHSSWAIKKKISQFYKSPIPPEGVRGCPECGPTRTRREKGDLLAFHMLDIALSRVPFA